MKQKLYTFLIFLGSALIIGCLFVVLLFWYFGRGLPDYKQLAQYDPPVVTRMHAGDGRLFAEYAYERRVFVPISSIPKHIVKTFLAVEDKNFYDHPGVDWTSIIRATFTNVTSIFRGRGITVGGSTITQQVAKNFLLTNEKTIIRKIKEAILALRIEHTFSKEKILELYLNEIYLGKRAYGVASAAIEYFGKSLDELTAAEAAFIAGLPKAPSTYNPERNYDAAIGRRNWVLMRMYEEGLINKKEALDAVEEPIKLQKRKNVAVVDANYFAEQVRQSIIKKYGNKTFYEGGLSVRTTLDSNLQELADRSLKRGLVKYDRTFGWRGAIANIDVNDWKENLNKIAEPPAIKPWVLAVVLDVQLNQAKIGLKNGNTGMIGLNTVKWARPHLIDKPTGYPIVGKEVKSVKDVLKKGDVIVVEHIKNQQFSLQQIPEINGGLVALDPHTGRVLAIDGGYRFSRSQFNRVDQAKRQPGSSFKPVVYTAALEAGFTPSTLVLDAPLVVDLGEAGEWKPRNITNRFYGWVPLRKALEQSYNLAAIRVGQQVGLSRIEDVAVRLGIYDSMPRELAMILGAEETTLMRMAIAFACFVNGGKKVNPVLIDRIQNRHGKTVYKADARDCSGCENETWLGQLPPNLEDDRKQVLNPVVAYQMTSLLEGVVNKGTGKRAAVPGYSVAGKTGTTNNYFDTWFIGFSPDLVVGVMVGFDNPKSLGRFQTGGSLAAPIFQNFMQEALKNKPKIPFRTPSGVRFYRVNPETGAKMKFREKGGIIEAFSPGTEPNENPTESIGADDSLISEQISGIY
jgi:penicillin-binding protein 1A